MENIENLMRKLDLQTSDKVCPMKMAAGSAGNCEGSKCAWWNPHYSGCCVGTAYLTQDYIGNQIAQVSDQLRAKEEC